MSLSGLSLLQIQDSAGRILSSGHFRNEFDQLQPELPRLLAAAPAPWRWFEPAHPEGPLRGAGPGGFVPGRRQAFSLVGGIEAEAAAARPPGSRW